MESPLGERYQWVRQNWNAVTLGWNQGYLDSAALTRACRNALRTTSDLAQLAPRRTLCTAVLQTTITLGSVDLHEHWEGIYTSRPPDVVSWYEPVPLMSRKLVVEACQEGAESVIDVGGGASSLVDELLELGVKRVAVLDISEAGLAVSKRRLGSRARRVEWIVGDVTTVEDIGPFDVWHDRAVFHFLTANEDRRRYVQLAEHTLPPGGTAVMATFASDGPARCSGLEVRRYDPGQLEGQCGPGFELIQSEPYVHATPSGSHQSFLFATFHRVVGNR